MGIKAIVNWLNANGHRTRQGATWGIGPVHVMLSNTVYAGVARFNQVDSRTRTRKFETEHVTAVVPIIIDPPIFERMQSLLKARNPRKPTTGGLGTDFAYGACILCDLRRRHDVVHRDVQDR